MLKSGNIVTITGVTGYLGSIVTQSFLKDGSYLVRGTVRSTKNAKKIAPLQKAYGDLYQQLTLKEADLLNKDSIEEAIAGSNYVVHTASPYFVGKESELIKPAVDGTLAVMEAARKHKVKRVVLTSSCAAVFNQALAQRKKVYTEEDFSTISPKRKL